MRPQSLRYDDDEIVQHMIKVLLNDLRIIHSYNYRDQYPISADIIAFHAINDVRIQLNDVEKWVDETQSEFKLYEVPGSHNFVYYETEAITRLINMELDDIVMQDLLTETKLN